MRRAVLLSLCLGFVLAVPREHAQNVNPGRPENMDVQHKSTPDEIRARVNNAQLQKDAQELAALCSSLETDLAGLKQGMLGKELLERLKRVEKLSKRLREELTR
jgi:hypothetical protein